MKRVRSPKEFGYSPQGESVQLADLMFDVSRGVLGIMGNSKGRDNAKKRARRRKKTERLALAKNKKKAAK